MDGDTLSFRRLEDRRRVTIAVFVLTIERATNPPHDDASKVPAAWSGAFRSIAARPNLKCSFIFEDNLNSHCRQAPQPKLSICNVRIDPFTPFRHL
jgi:hypothetical protein